MKLGMKSAKNKRQNETLMEEASRKESEVIDFLDIKKWSVPEGHVEVEYYPLKPPFSYAAVVQNEETLEYLYILDELPLNRSERDGYFKLRNILEFELQAPEAEETLAESFRRHLPEVLAKHKGTAMSV